MDDIYAGYFDTPTPFAEKLADFIIDQSHRTGESVQDLWMECERVAAESQVTITR